MSSLVATNPSRWNGTFWRVSEREQRVWPNAKRCSDQGWKSSASPFLRLPHFARLDRRRSTRRSGKGDCESASTVHAQLSCALTLHPSWRACRKSPRGRTRNVLTGPDAQAASGGPHRCHVRFRWPGREVGERLHHNTPLFQSLAAFVGLFSIVARDVVEAMLDNLLLEVGLFLRPGPESRAESVHG